MTIIGKIRIVGAINGSSDVKETERCVIKACKVSQKFFTKVSPKFNVLLFYSRNDYDSEVGRRTRNWEAGVSNKRRLAIFAPSKFNELTDNKMSFSQIMTHEINHIFYMNFVHTFTPQWLMEGLASTVDGSPKLYDWNGKPKKEHLYFSLAETDRKGKSDEDISEFYRSSHLMTKNLIKNVGLKRLISLLRIYSKKPTRRNYERLFIPLL